ncbi:serine protease [Catellatospora sp. TT07R-123]|nr:serine protease [Catellatospora sp. TT07R-123]
MPWSVRIVDWQGDVLGAGVVVTRDSILTCAHVIRANTGEVAADAVVRVEFVGRPDLPAREARVLRWFPPQADHTGDIAVLRLAKAVPADIVGELRRRPVKRATKVRAVGFPVGAPTGLEATASVRTSHGPRNEWVLLTPYEPGPTIRQGYSGAGVIDAHGDLIGIVVAVYEADNASSMIPVETILKYVPQLDLQITGEPRLDQSIVDRVRPEFGDAAFGRAVAAFLSGVSDKSLLSVSMDDAPTERYAELARMLVLSDRERSPREADGAPPVPLDSVAAALDVSGMDTDEVHRRLADRLGPAPAGSDNDLDPAGLLIVLIGVDEARTPESLVPRIVEPFVQQGARILLVFRHAGSRVRALADAFQSTLHDGAPFPELAAKIDQVRAAERMARGQYRVTARLVKVDVRPSDSSSSLRMDLSGLRAARSKASAAQLEQARAALADRAQAALEAAVRLTGFLRKQDDRLTELLGRLDSYRAMADSLSGALPNALGTRYRLAEAALMARPVDLAEAEALVEAYAAAVRDRRPR